MSTDGWIGVDLDGTLAHYDGWRGIDHIGAPIPAMIDRVKAWLSDHVEVRIFTARVYPLPLWRPDDGWSLLDIPKGDAMEAAGDALAHVAKWCEEHFGHALPITCTKDYGMVELWDDRAVQVEINTGLAYVHPHGMPTP